MPHALSADDARPWGAMSGELLQGLAHAFGNRVFALGALHDALVDDGADAELRDALGDEVGRLQGCLRALRLLAPDHRPAEAIHFLALLDDVEVLQAFHHELRDVVCERSVDGEIPPVFARRGALAPLLMLLVGAARRAAAASGGVAVLRCSADEETVRLEVSPTGASDEPAASAVEDMARAAAVLAARLDASLLLTGNGDGWTLSLPTLAAVRRREREGAVGG
jgi:nitrogen-specific signal transduction histidine kinase